MYVLSVITAAGTHQGKLTIFIGFSVTALRHTTNSYQLRLPPQIMLPKLIYTHLPYRTMSSRHTFGIYALVLTILQDLQSSRIHTSAIRLRPPLYHCRVRSKFPSRQ